MWPEEVLKLVAEVVQSHPNDIEASVEEFLSRAPRLPSWRGLVDSLVRRAVQELIYDHRHRETVKTKKVMGQYGGGSRLNSTTSESLRRVAERQLLDSYYIGGKRLGSIVGKEIPSLMDQERGRRNGHDLNLRVLDYLNGRVRGEQTVDAAMRQRASLTSFNETFRNLYRQAFGRDYEEAG